jgi:2-enoate reductase
MAASTGAEVELVTSRLLPAAVLTPHQGGALAAARLQAAGVAVSTLTSIREIGDHRAVLVSGSGTRTVDNLSAVVLATMRKPVHSLYEELEGRVAHLYLVGDAFSPRRLREATYEGFRFGSLVGDEVMPADMTELALVPMEPLRPAALA